MKQRKEENRIVYQSLGMVTQFGLNMIVPICAMSALGVWLDRKLGTSYLTIFFFAVGAVAECIPHGEAAVWRREAGSRAGRFR